MPRFVILRHDPPDGTQRPVHWDFMLESSNRLRTWALQEEPRPGATIAAVLLTDHRTAYLDYEGPVSRNRGTVTRWDHGTYATLRESDAIWQVRLNGSGWSGVADLRRDAENPDRWDVEFSAG
jgi:hypothetical protein